MPCCLFYCHLVYQLNPKLFKREPLLYTERFSPGTPVSPTYIHTYIHTYIYFIYARKLQSSCRANVLEKIS